MWYTGGKGGMTMNTYVTGTIIRRLRETKGLTQAALAQQLGVSDKAVSKWETGRGYPDITLVEPLAGALGVSVVELLSGDEVLNRNRSFNMKKLLFYVCPICGNVVAACGEAVICCCGVTLLPCGAEAPDEAHEIPISVVEDEYYVNMPHEMTRSHNISFLAAVGDNGVSLVKLYPEGGAEARFKISRTRRIYAFCNRHGLFCVTIPMRRG